MKRALNYAKDLHTWTIFSGELFCKQCKSVWPCHTAIVIEACEIMLAGQLNITVSKEKEDDDSYKELERLAEG